jgi:methyl-accepting chemotaxis protein
MFAVNKLSVSQRLGIGFGILVALLLGVCGLAYYSLDRSQKLLHDNVQVAQDRLELAMNMHLSVQEQDIRIRQIGLMSDVPEMQKQAELAKTANLAFGRALKTLESDALSAEEKAALAAISKIDATNKPVAEKALGLATSMMQEDAAKVISGPLEQLSIQRRDMVARFASLQRDHLKMAYQAINSSAAQARSLMVMAAIVGLLSAVLCGWLVSRSIVVPLRQAVGLAERVSAGDLTAQLLTDRQDEVGQLMHALDRMADRLRAMIGAMRSTSESIMCASREIAGGNQDLSQRTEEQAASLQMTASTVDEITRSVAQSAQSSQEAARLAQRASEVAVEGGTRVNDVVDTMGRMSASSQRIADIVGVIDGIAFQTNILALNAAVEAARAGEQGRGFAVVASEVRGLAQRSAQAAKEVKALIAQNVETVTDGTKLASEAGRTMSEIVRSSERVAAIIVEISNATQTQASGLGEVNSAIAKIDQTTQQNAALVEQSAAAAESLKEQTVSLNGAIAEFRMADATA